MEYKTISTQTKYVRYGDLTEGETVLDGATYKGEKEGKFGANYVFDQDGQKIVLGSAGYLNYIVREGQLGLGDKVRMTYNGKKKLKDGKTAHDFKIEIACAEGKSQEVLDEPIQEELNF